MSAPGASTQTLEPLPAPRTVGVWSAGIARIPHLAALLGAERVVLRPTPLTRVDAVAGWGRKANTARARRAADRRGVPYLTLEDGFLRSLGLGVTGAPPLSIVVDDRGVYYDATSPSRLERMLASDEELDAPALARARAAIARIREERLSKYNAAPVRSLGPRERPRVLVVDQTAGDLSLERGLCVERPFDAMLRAALDEHPRAEVVVKTHPDVASGKKRGHFRELRASARVRLLTDAVNPIALLEEVDHVYVATSLLGFEALLLGREVTCFGVPFYAGWGLTDDRAPVPRRRARPTLEALFTAAYLRYARYVDPETGERCELERIIEHLALQRRLAEENARTSVCVGFSIWKRGFLPPFLASPRGEVRFASDAKAARRALRGASERARVVVWGTREGDALREVAARSEAPIWRMEDGFLRSVGLGTDLYAPASLVLDREGIYYDPRTPSDLERILAEAEFTDEERARARLLRERIVEAGITKYNLGPRRELASKWESGGRDVVLVVGQVEADASIALGTLDVRKNEQLLLAARRARPHAYLVYKPHPDVVSKNREDSLPLSLARRMCDEVVIDASLADCLRAASEVHTMTSLVGFEALLRGLAVAVYGQPFYAGWGLTTDRHPHPRRTRRLSLDELVAGALIRYPRYVHPVSGCFTTPEAIVEHLARARERGPQGWQQRWPARQRQKLVNLAKGALGVS